MPYKIDRFLRCDTCSIDRLLLRDVFNANVSSRCDMWQVLTADRGFYRPVLLGYCKDLTSAVLMV